MFPLAFGEVAASIAPEHIEVQAYVEAMWKKAHKLYQTSLDALERKDFDQAVALLGGALAVTPDDMKLLITRASANRQRGACELALADLEVNRAAARSGNATGCCATQTQRTFYQQKRKVDVHICCVVKANVKRKRKTKSDGME